MARLYDAFDRLACQHSAEWQAAAERLRECDDVGNDAALLKREQRSGAPESALDFVEDQDGAGAIGNATRRREIFMRQRNDSAFAHHRLEDDRVRFVSHCRFECGDIVRRDERHAGHERLERRAIRGVSSQRERAESSSVKALFERHDVVLSGIRQSRKLQRRLIRLGSAVAEKRAEQSRRAHKALAKDSLRRVIEKIGDVKQRFRLAAQRLHQPRMLMAEHIDGDATEEVPVFVAVSVGQARAFA